MADQDERALRTERERLALAERRLKFRLAVGIIVVSFLFVLAQSMAPLFGRHIDLPPWQYWSPFVIAAIFVVFNIDFRDVVSIRTRTERKGPGDE